MKELKDYLSNKATKELIATISERENLNREKSPYLCNRDKHGGNRNEAGEGKMRELFQFERKVADLINEGFLIDFDSTMDYLRRMWCKMQTPISLREQR